jgi:hypothetical protein
MKMFGVIKLVELMLKYRLQNEQFDKCFSSLEDYLNHYFPLKTKSNEIDLRGIIKTPSQFALFACGV